MDAIASSVAGVSPERQAKRVQMNASKSRDAKRSKTATVELVDAASEATAVEHKSQDAIHPRPATDLTTGHLLNIIA